MKHYTLAQLEAFAAIARLGSFQAAADSLGVTQPTVSLRMRDLEHALGQRLFERQGRGRPRPTPAGRSMLPQVERVLALLDDMDEQLESSPRGREVIRLGASNTFALAFLPSVLAQAEGRLPSLSVDVTISDSNNLAAAMNAGNLDVAVLLAGNLRRGVHVEPLATYDIAWLSAASTQVPHHVRGSDLKGRRIISLPMTSPLSRTILDWFDASDATPPAHNTCNDMATLIRLIASGTALSILPLCVVEGDLRRGAIVAHSSEPRLEPYQICIAYPTRSARPILQSFLDVIRRTMRDIGSAHVAMA
jgi:LysR family cyn operon transcriptional activator